MNSPQKTIVTRELMSSMNEGCAACGKPFEMGETVVMACGAWGDNPKFVHEKEAVYDKGQGRYVEQGCHEAGRGGI